MPGTGLDIALRPNADGILDVSIGADGDLVGDESFETAILISLRTNVRATAEEVDDPGKRGGSATNEGLAVPMGSLLWLLKQARVTVGTVLFARDWTAAALRWLVDLNYVADVSTTADVGPEPDQIVISVTITSFTGAVSTRFFDLWLNTARGTG